jgi:hypothetical protein
MTGMPARRLAAPPRTVHSLVVRALVRAEAMGLIRAHDAETFSGSESMQAALRKVLEAARAAGIGQALTVPADPRNDEEWRALAAHLFYALEESPVPMLEWTGLERVLSAALLASLVGVSASSLRRYASGARPTPDAVAVRLHALALVVGDLAGSYNALGVRRWFGRTRAQLNGQAPIALLSCSWHPQDEGPVRVRELAATLLGAPAA